MSGALHTPGPYWIKMAKNAEQQICGRHGKILFRYPAGQGHLADAHLRRLQRGHTASGKAVQGAAQDLFEALQLADRLLSGANMNKRVVERKVRAALAKARGEQVPA